MNKITVDFEDLNLTITKTRDQWVKELHEYCLAECAESCAYNDNTLSDFLMNGFKGFANMNDEELTEEIIYALESKYDTLEVK
jgi:hypothetical protein